MPRSVGVGVMDEWWLVCLRNGDFWSLDNLTTIFHSAPHGCSLTEMAQEWSKWYYLQKLLEGSVRKLVRSKTECNGLRCGVWLFGNMNLTARMHQRLAESMTEAVGGLGGSMRIEDWWCSFAMEGGREAKNKETVRMRPKIVVCIFLLVKSKESPTNGGQKIEILLTKPLKNELFEEQRMGLIANPARIRHFKTSSFWF